MKYFSLKQLADIVNGKVGNNGENVVVNAVIHDTRTMLGSALYLPVKGLKFDGYEFINTAFENGAVAVIVDEEWLKKNADKLKSKPFISVPDAVVAVQKLAVYLRNQVSPVVIGITGSNGKTTTKEFVGKIFSVDGSTIVNPSSWNNYLGLPLTLCRLNNNTKYCVLEIGTNHFGEVSMLAKIALPDIGVITNIGRAHLEAFIDEEGVLKEKCELFNNIKHGGTAVVNIDDKRLAGYVLRGDIRKVTYSVINVMADVHLIESKVNEDIGGCSGKVAYGIDVINFDVPLWGEHNIANLVSAVSCAYAAGIRADVVERALVNLELPKLRQEVVVHKSGAVIVVDCYNANPDSMKKSIAAVKDKYAGKKIVLVLGEMLELGDSAEKEHREIGLFIGALKVQNTLLYGKNAGLIGEELGKLGRSWKLYSEKDELSRDLIKELTPGVVVLVKGSRLLELEKVVESIK
ncbi:MAG: UDP-N-acetylmuramoyl-tripeptide--D-alanyl-D-alanine ligase [Elusimicrobiota bacterium]